MNVESQIDEVFAAGCSAPVNALRKNLAMVSTSAPVNVSYCLRRLLAELQHLGGLMGTILQVNMKQGQGKHYQFTSWFWQNQRFVNLTVSVLGMIFFCSYSLHLTFSFFSSEIALVYHGALIILFGFPATTGLNLFTSYGNVPYVWAIIQGIFYYPVRL